MTVSDLLNSCQNIWKDDHSMNYNEKFCVMFVDVVNRTLTTNYKTLKESTEYLRNYRKQQVRYFEIHTINFIVIGIKSLLKKYEKEGE